MFFTIIAILSISLVYNFHKIKKYQRHDFYLFKFYSLRREIMSYLRINHELISKQEYKAIKQILDIVNRAINLYSKNDTTNLFKVRMLAKFLKNTKNFSDLSINCLKCDNITINNFQKNLRQNIIETFFAYTPFLLTKRWVNILYYLGKIFGGIQFLKFKKWSAKLLALNEDFISIKSSIKQLMV
jgi:hypothetical protein